MRKNSSLKTRTVTLQNVADKAGVGLSTASYILNNKPKLIREETRERVWHAAQELGYRPNMAARALVTRQTHIIVLWIPNVATAFSTRVIAEIQKQARLRGYEVMICDTDWAEVKTEDAHHDAHRLQSLSLRQMPLWNVDGVIAFFGSSACNINWDLQNGQQVPIISMGTFSIPGTDFVRLSVDKASQEAVEWLIASSRQRIGFLVPFAADFAGDERHEAYLRTILEANQQPLFIHMNENSRAAAYEATRCFLRDNENVDALFCYNDYAAIGASRALHEAGLKIPDDVLVVGCDGIEDIQYLSWPLNTIELPIPQMCASAWEFLTQRLNDLDLPLQQSSFVGHFKTSAL